jgi:predicted transcriptional regulator
MKQLSLFCRDSALSEITNSGQRETVKERVYQIIKWRGKTTRAEIAAKHDIRLATVCGRVKELIDELRVFEDGTIVDLETKKTVTVLRAI